MIKNIKAAIFDLDGTLVDSMWIWRGIDIEYLGRYNITIPDDLQSAIEGMSFSETAVYFKNRFSLKDSIETIKDDWNTMAKEYYQTKVPIKPGADKFISYLKSKKIKLGIATSNSRELASTVLEALHIKDYFDDIITSCEVKAGKPSPYIYIQSAKNIQTEPKDCLVFEDVPMGIIAGKRAGMKVCAVEDEFSANMKKEKISLSDYYIDDYHQLLIDNL